MKKIVEKMIELPSSYQNNRYTHLRISVSFYKSAWKGSGFYVQTHPVRKEMYGFSVLFDGTKHCMEKNILIKKALRDSSSFREKSLTAFIQSLLYVGFNGPESIDMAGELIAA